MHEPVDLCPGRVSSICRNSLNYLAVPRAAICQPSARYIPNVKAWLIDTALGPHRHQAASDTCRRKNHLVCIGSGVFQSGSCAPTLGHLPIASLSGGRSPRLP